MLRYALKRFLSLLISLAIASLVIFAVIEVAPGDPAWMPRNVAHWHEAGPESSMTHATMQRMQDGSVANSLEHVTDADYSF